MRVNQSAFVHSLHGDRITFPRKITNRRLHRSELFKYNNNINIIAQKKCQYAALFNRVAKYSYGLVEELRSSLEAAKQIPE